MKVIHLLRKPLSEGTVAANTIKHGTGGLNIDATRIAWEKAGPNPSTSRREAAARSGAQGGAMGLRAAETEGVGALRDRSSLQAFTASRQGELIGRWPANVILQHLDGCRRDGNRTVKGQKGSGLTQTPARSWKNTSTAGINRVGHADEDGNETTPNWICVEGCPVEALDEQSGVSKGTVRQPTGRAIYATEGASVNWNPNSVMDTTVRGFIDTGGASRFFKQVAGGFEK